MGWGVRDYPSPPEKPQPVCPVCGQECGKVYMDFNRNVVGCDECLLEMDAEEWRQEREESERYG